jgi:methanol metabolism-related c-type cytochrome
VLRNEEDEMFDIKGKRVKRFALVLCAATAVGLAGLSELASAEGAKAVTLPDGSATQEGATLQDGKWVLPDGTPTYNVAADKKVDWYTWSGFRRYHSECHVCHGPEGEGSTYAPALVTSLKTMDYSTFLGIVASGQVRKDAGTEYIMPALGDNKNVMCYIEDIYVYLKARSDGAQPRGRPAGRADAPQAFKDNEAACLGS